MQLKREFVSDGPSGDYDLVSRAIAVLADARGEPPSIGQVADRIGIGSAGVEQAFARWCGLSFDAVQRILSPADVRGRLVGAGTVLDERRRWEDTPVAITAVITDERKRRGEGLDIVYGFHPSPFGEALVMMTDGAVCGIAFVDGGDEAARREALADMTGRWPKARFVCSPDRTEAMTRQIFAASPSAAHAQAVPLALIGTAFDVDVWKTLLRIPMGKLVSYTDIARCLGRADAVRAVGTANGRNPISFVVPCHRALRGDGTLGGYYWGLTRKRALIVWEAGRVAREVTF
jgi:AraC family transcriptional regulator of adaptative response/methylated-DNA-[protein]-cysteine methyltransferase